MLKMLEINRKILISLANKIVMVAVKCNEIFIQMLSSKLKLVKFHFHEIK